MKKFIFLILIITLSFGDIKGLGKLFNYIFPLLSDKKVIKIYTLPIYYKYFSSNHFIIVKDCNKSDIILGNIKCDNKPVFSLNYNFYRNYKNVFGVFYYRKGRPQLKFKKDDLIKFFHKIPNELKGYVE